jgi:hypothetical protein
MMERRQAQGDSLAVAHRLISRFRGLCGRRMMTAQLTVLTAFFRPDAALVHKAKNF